METFLDELLAADHAATGWTGGAQVVGHSGGGMLTFPVLNRRPELFHSLLFTASGTMATSKALPGLSVYGCKDNRLGANKTMFTPDNWL